MMNAEYTIEDVARIVTRPSGRGGDPTVSITQTRRTFDPTSDTRVSIVVSRQRDEDCGRLVVDEAAWLEALGAALRHDPTENRWE
jgi:hypothetical protein